MKRNEHVQISDYIKLPQFWAFEQSPRHWLMSSPTRPLTDISTMFLIAWIWMFGSQTRRFEKPWRCLPQTTTISYISYPPPKSWRCEISDKRSSAQCLEQPELTPRRLESAPGIHTQLSAFLTAGALFLGGQREKHDFPTDFSRGNPQEFHGVSRSQVFHGHWKIL